MVAASLLLIFSSCEREEGTFGFYEYTNTTSLSCTVCIDEFFELQIPSGETGVAKTVVYSGGDFYFDNYPKAFIKFADGAEIQYSGRDHKIGSPLEEKNYDIRTIDGKLHLSMDITEEIHQAALNQ